MVCVWDWVNREIKLCSLVLIKKRTADSVYGRVVGIGDD